jgi:DnaJ-domain-containing protein 1
VIDITREEIFQAILEERERQDKLHPTLNFKKSDDPEIQALRHMIICNEFLAVLVEEVGEVASALQGEGSIRDELVQVAAVCVKWLEKIKSAE